LVSGPSRASGGRFEIRAQGAYKTAGGWRRPSGLRASHISASAAARRPTCGGRERSYGQKDHSTPVRGSDRGCGRCDVSGRQRDGSVRRRPGQRRRRLEEDRSAGEARRPALLGARRYGTAQHRVEQPAGSGPDDGPPRRPELPGRSQRPGPPRAASGRLQRGVRLPRVGGYQGVRVLPVDAGRERARPAAHGCGDQVVSGRCRSGGVRHASVRPDEPQSRDW
jgi:hypothetical protein